MNNKNKIRINSSCILTVPFYTYDNDFTFIVNDKEFKTSRLISDLLSPKICYIHQNDPTFSTFTINTSVHGDFTHILDLFRFQNNTIPSTELPFLSEVVEQLGSDSIELECGTESVKITTNNVMSLIKQHEKCSRFYKSRLSEEISFVCTHFTELSESRADEFAYLSLETVLRIIGSERLRLECEDELLRLVNSLYMRDKKYECLYEFVLFENVTRTAIREFTTVFDASTLSGGTWMRLKMRLEEDLHKNKEMMNGIDRYRVRKFVSAREFVLPKQNGFNGIISFLKNRSNGEIEKEVCITASSIYNDSECYQPQNVFLFENQNKFFFSTNKQNGWLCFDFKDHRVTPTGYTIRSCKYGKNGSHPRSWVIECSNDNSSWETVDEEQDCGHLNGFRIVHTFRMNKPTSKKFRYIRMRLTEPNWSNDNFFLIDSIEIYGSLHFYEKLN